MSYYQHVGIQCGHTVMLKIEKIKGMITGICIRFDRIQYEFSYFHNGDIKIIWLSENEFDQIVEKETAVGFNRSLVGASINCQDNESPF